MLEAPVQERLKSAYEQLLTEGSLPSLEKLKECYRTFRERFGPEALRGMDGEELLNTMHAHGSRDSLVYWLEFKNDQEFPDYFGSIAGGSALKFGIYKRRETGAWMIDRGQGQEEISLREAITVARSNRDQLAAGAQVLDQFAAEAPDDNYTRMQGKLAAESPRVFNTAWGHKYFSLLFPEKLDDFHVEDFQRFYIRKMLQIPPTTDGRYSAAGRYVDAAGRLRIPMNHLSTTLRQTYGRPYRVWRIGTRLGGTNSIWELMKDGGCIAIGWPVLGDLSTLPEGSAARDELRKKLEEDEEIPTVAGRNANQIFAFLRKIDDDDLVVAADGEQILGIGKVTGPYQYDASGSPQAPHRRSVTWLDINTWKLPQTEGLRSTVRELKRYPINLVEIERRLSSLHDRPTIEPRVGSPSTARRLEHIPGRIQAALDRKGQVILYGPPGTGKTYWATATAQQLGAHAAFGRNFDELIDAARAEVSSELVRHCTFHPAFGYEDFIEGYRPESSAGGALSFRLRDGIFKRLCRDAISSPGKRFYLVIDEINRGDIPRIFGELITLLEFDKRGRPVQLPLSGQPFSVPNNVYVIGTMNTADRSIALLDTALRRRFGFIELLPDPTIFGGATAGNSVPLGLWLSALNDRIRKHVQRDARNLQVGHAYLMAGGQAVTDIARFAQILADDIIPLIEEYCYEDFGALKAILGPAFFDEATQRVRSELFTAERRDDLIQALLAPTPDIATSTIAVAAERTEAPEPPDDQSDETV